MLAVAMAAIALVACDAKPKPLEVIYYYKSGAPSLAERQAGIAALANEFPGRVHTRAVDASSAEAQHDLEHLEIGTSGVAVRNGNKVLLYKQGETAWDIGRVREAVRGALGAASP